jgi:hypothetical protein
MRLRESLRAKSTLSCRLPVMVKPVLRPLELFLGLNVTKPVKLLLERRTIIIDFPYRPLLRQGRCHRIVSVCRPPVRGTGSVEMRRLVRCQGPRRLGNGLQLFALGLDRTE